MTHNGTFFPLTSSSSHFRVIYLQTQNRMAFSTTTTATDRKRQQYLLSLPKFVVPEQKWAHYQMHAGGRTNAEKTRRHIKQVGQMYRRKMQKA